MIRGRIQSVVEGVIKRFSAFGRADETISNREYIQHYGFTSRPLAEAEAVIINEGNHFVMIASDDRRYRIAIEAGEVCLYTDEGDHIRFKRGKEIYIKSGNKLLAEIANDVEINTTRIVANASESAKVKSPLIVAHASVSAEVKSPVVSLKSDALTMTSYTEGTTPLAHILGNLRIEGNVEVINGNITVDGEISASGTIIDGSGNTNHHVHP